MTMADYLIEIRADENVVLLPIDGETIADLETAVTRTLQSQKTHPPVALTIMLTNDASIQQLNRDFLGYDKPTDVLSFPAGDPPPGVEGLPTYLGDIIIAVPYAKRQAEAAGHNLLAELQLLAVHGALHLLGFDHAEPEEKQAMWAAQTAVLDQLGLAHIAPTEQ